MTDQRILDSVLAKLGLARITSDTPAPADPPSGSRPGVISGKRSREIENRLDFILGQHHSAVEDRVFLIKLDRCREKFGKKWEQVQTKIHETVRSIMATRLSDQDMYIQRDSESYLIVFGSLTRKEAQFKCTIIGEEILRRLVGRESVNDLVDIKTVQVADDGKVRFKDLPRIENLLEEVAEQVDHFETAGKVDHASTQAKIAGCDSIRFIFRPMLAVRTKMISTFMCIPIRTLRGQLCVSGYDVLGDHAIPGQFLELDLVVLEKVAYELNRLGEKREKSLVGLSVHFETLADLRRRTRYLHRCSESIDGNADRVVFEVVGLPDGIPQVRLVDLVSSLRPYARAVIARFTPEHRNFPAFRTSGLHAVGIDIYASLKREDVLMREMDNFAQAANRNKLKTYVSGIRSLSLYTAVVAAGYDYAAGHALTSISDAAEGAYIYRMETPYISALENEDGGLPTFSDHSDDILSPSGE